MLKAARALLLLLSVPVLCRGFPNMGSQVRGPKIVSSNSTWHHPSRLEEDEIRAELRYIIDNPVPIFYDDGEPQSISVCA